MKNNKKGFTLIELLVVIAIIGLLSTLAVVALNNAREKSRDARRVADIKQMQTALELYYNDCQQYPDMSGGALTTALNNCTGATATFGDYMQIVPTDPGTGAYTYGNNAGDLSSYAITYTLEGPTGGISSGPNTATPAGISE
jgi:type II secretion system protein G